MNRKRLSRQTLEQLGLEDRDAYHLERVDFYAGEVGHLHLGPEWDASRGCLALGSDGPVVIGIMPGDATVYALEADSPRLVNTTAVRFVRSVLRFEEYCSEVVDAADDAGALDIVKKAASELKSIDPEAWTDSTNYWPVVAQQMEEGNL